MKEKLYKIVSKAAKESLYQAKSCRNCFAGIVKMELDKAQLYDYFKYDGSPCSAPLFYLEDQGIIKILQGVPERGGGIECRKLKFKILRHEGNKI